MTCLLTEQQQQQQQQQEETCLSAFETTMRDAFLFGISRPFSAIDGVDLPLFLAMREGGIANYINVKNSACKQAALPPFEEAVYRMLLQSLTDLTLFKFVVRSGLYPARVELLQEVHNGKEAALKSPHSRLRHSYPKHVEFVRRKYEQMSSAYERESFLKYYCQLALASVYDYSLMEPCLERLQHVFSLRALPINTNLVS
ncbi:MAG: hypothetical protein E6Q06_01960 [Candidatus Moraniibacteriota bacterium]|nr:MAG: hypothetical protein E6Q06_01960 [Candidatus Moranbacteria bacterium]